MRRASIFRRAGLGALLTSGFAVAAGGAEGGETLAFVDVAVERGVIFEHRTFQTGEKHMPENMGAGVAIFDYDLDGDLDLYLVQGAPVEAAGPQRWRGNLLLEQQDDGTFVDRTQSSGLGDLGLGMGVVVGDVDGDGWPDLYVTNYGPNVLYRNGGDGSFERLDTASGDLWSTGAAFFDLESDGDLDLYVASYVEFEAEGALFCGNAQTGLRAFCHPDLYRGARDVVYRNEGDGTWTSLDDEVGVMEGDEGRGLGVLAADLDLDGTIDLYVANDTTANYLYRVRDGRLIEGALLAGLAVNGNGEGEASMGLAAGDLDGDGRPELFSTHLDEETNTLYRGAAAGLFLDATDAAGLGVPSRPWVGFGTVMADLDLDGDLDLAVANGHIIDNIAEFDPALRHAQPLQFFVNDGDGRFEERDSGYPALVGRGLAAGDLDRDGDVDLVLTQNGGPALVLDNRAGSGRSVSITFARESIDLWHSRWRTDDGQHRGLERAPSYLSQSAAEVVLACGRDETTLEVSHLDGRRVRFERLRCGRRFILATSH